MRFHYLLIGYSTSIHLAEKPVVARSVGALVLWREDNLQKANWKNQLSQMFGTGEFCVFLVGINSSIMGTSYIPVLLCPLPGMVQVHGKLPPGSNGGGEYIDILSS